ncbi:hypothetical protein [Streptomyces acidicola]|uniref:hypothetical protein n=1 Tax=Streptomyces acidicola TaxID=2596892 RepID=UPI003418938E
MSTETHPAAAAPWTTQVLRATAILGLLVTLLQGLLAGLFVTGDVGLLTVHSVVGSAISVLALVQFAIALVERRARRRRDEPNSWRLTVLSGLFLVLVFAQIGLGMSRAVAPHMFLGVTAAALAMLVLFVVLTESGSTPAQTPAQAPAQTPAQTPAATKEAL